MANEFATCKEEIGREWGPYSKFYEESVDPKEMNIFQLDSVVVGFVNKST